MIQRLVDGLVYKFLDQSVPQTLQSLLQITRYRQIPQLQVMSNTLTVISEHSVGCRWLGEVEVNRSMVNQLIA